MIKKSEISSLIIGIILMTLIIGFSRGNLVLDELILGLISSIIIIGVSVLSKLYSARVLDCSLDFKILEWKRYGFTRKSVFKYAVPAGVIFPLIISVVTLGYVKFFCFFEFDAKALPSKVSKRFGSRRFSNISDWDDALIVFYSTLALLILSIITSSLNFTFTKDLAILSALYATWNLIPWGRLDGSRLFFGSRPLFVFTIILTILTWLAVAFLAF